MGPAQTFFVHLEPATNVSATTVLPRGVKASAGAISIAIALAETAETAESPWPRCRQ
jgi:hypothetical protein